MRLRAFAVFAILSFVATCGSSSSALAQTASCSDFDAWEWAQAIFESDPQAYDALDPDTDGIACPELPRGGFAPAFWTDSIPADAEEAQVTRFIDGDTFEVSMNGETYRIRIYRADTPETQDEQHCGGQEATSYTQWALSFNDNPGIVSLERNETTQDQYGRELAYVWFESGGDPYMLNHILINNGWADDKDYGDHLYDTQLQDAAAFAQRHDLGVYGLCGDWQIPLPNPEPVPPVDGPDNSDSSAGQDGSSEPEPAPEPEPDPGNGCDPNYDPCVPLSSSDLDCADVGFSVIIVGGDPHGLDGNDNDGYGCESF
jgi:endonuclease YncB( thermonuclease family)